MATILAAAVGFKSRVLPAENTKVSFYHCNYKSSHLILLFSIISKARGRSDFKSEPCKLTTVEGWLVMVPEHAGPEAEVTSWQLADPVMRNVYRFRDGTGATQHWVYHLTRATRGLKSKTPPTNLMSFE